MKEPIKNEMGDREINAENVFRNNNFKSKDCLLEENNIKDLNSTCSKNMVPPITIILKEENHTSNTYEMMENNKNIKSNDDVNNNNIKSNDDNIKSNDNDNIKNNDVNNNNNNTFKSETYIYSVNNKKPKEDKAENIQNGNTNNNIIIYTNKKNNENNNCLNDVINKYLNDLDNQEKVLPKGEHDKCTNNINVLNNTYNINNNNYYYTIMNTEGDILNKNYNNYFNDNNNSYIYHENNNINMNPYLNIQGYIYNRNIEEQQNGLCEQYIPYTTNNNDDHINNFINEVYDEDSYNIYFSI
ncbi:hypothetical protein PFMG_03641 [Plasmodium falciparum IGH-CR14]|uniref:Uncharacterized protein n=1 Tax=Plasmodium falciparum IGH-CR14 TaxID=580059 RepID=A0A0L1ID29_PLAFA|nr:hypothetical protein PFMG_03641 [Plasmodium falciparum IGH-CR14]